MANMPQGISVSPRKVVKTVRPDVQRIKTSGYAGKILPLAYVPILREDSFQGRAAFDVDMEETALPLDNAVGIKLYAHFVPFLAMSQFDGSMDKLNAAWSKEQGAESFFLQTTSWSVSPLYKTMGLHWDVTTPVNRSVAQAYNAIVNFRYAARSKNLPQRENDYDFSLATALWNHAGFSEIVPSFDEAMLDGEVPLNIVNSKIPVVGLGTSSTGYITPTSQTWSNGETPDHMTNNANNYYAVDTDMIPQVFAEMQQNGITVSLANIELAKKTAAYAALQKQYAGHLDDESLVRMLMDGIRVPDAALKQPILMGYQTSLFGYSRRYSTESDALDISVTDGRAHVEMPLNLPPMNTGGIIMITAEILPEQIFERKEDKFLTEIDVDFYPHAMRDSLKPQPVDVVKNGYIDVDHTTPDGVFGYAPMNHVWKRDFTRIGGRYHKPTAGEVFSEDRMSVWTVEAPDPEYNDNWLLASDLHHKVFEYEEIEPFIFHGRVEGKVVGLTQFGVGLQESADDFDKVLAEVDTDRIEQETEE